MKEIKDPHDRFFKDSFSEKEAAIDFLRYYIPSQVSSILNLAAIELVKHTFVDKEFESYYSDLLYKVGLKEGSHIYVYVLFEHKSHADGMISFQLLRYMVKTWEYMLKQGQKLMSIFPLVIYHGKEKWDVGLNFQDLIKPHEALKEYIVNYQYSLCDLSYYGDNELKGAALLQAILLTMKHIFNDELKDRLPDIFKLLEELLTKERGLDFIESILRYLMSGTDRITEQELADVAETVFPQGGTLMSTIAQKWLDQGVEIGRKEGWQEGEKIGWEKGIWQGLLDGIELGIELKFGTEGVRELPAIKKIDDLDILHAILEGLKTAKSLADLRRIYCGSRD